MTKKTLLLGLLSVFTLSVTAQKYVGGDISMLTKYEEAGVEYKDKGGNTVQPLTFFKEQGLNAMRVRLFVDPSQDSDKGVCQDLDYVKALGKRIKDAGLSLMLDFHYSDTWADPGKQWTPDAWKTLTDAQLAQQVYEYTKDCLQQMKDAGATPDFIQTGNEISYGMLWGTQAAVGSNNNNRCYTNSPAANWNRFFNLLKQAGKACREICPDAKIVIHSERTPKANVLTDYFDRMKANAIDYDIIGLSYYPDHHGSFTVLESALSALESKSYGKNIMIVETGYGYNWSIGSEYSYTWAYPLTEEGQRQFTADLIEALNAHESVTGLFWWWPEDNGDKNVTDKWWNAGLYNHSSGAPYAAFYELKKFVGENGEEQPQETDITSQFSNMDFANCVVDGSTITECPGWTINSEQGWSPWPVAVNEWHSPTISGYCIQAWVGNGSSLSAGNIIYQTIDNLPAGTYTVSAVVHTGYNGIYLFANNDTKVVPTADDKSSWGTAYEVSVTTKLATPGSLTLGLTLAEKPTISGEINFYADNFKCLASTAGINTVKTTANRRDDAWYTLDGRKLSGQPKQKGIYINGNAKVMIK